MFLLLLNGFHKAWEFNYYTNSAPERVETKTEISFIWIYMINTYNARELRVLFFLNGRCSLFYIVHIAVDDDNVYFNCVRAPTVYACLWLLLSVYICSWICIPLRQRKDALARAAQTQTLYTPCVREYVLKSCWACVNSN